MDVYLSLDDENRVIGWSMNPGTGDEFLVDVPNTHEVIRNPFVFTYANGELKKDEVFQDKLQKEHEKESKTRDLGTEIDNIWAILNVLTGVDQDTTEGTAAQVFAAVKEVAKAFPAEKAKDMPTLYPDWIGGQAYAIGEIVKVVDMDIDDPKKQVQLYQVLQAHTSQWGWRPHQTPALYKNISFSSSGVPNWVQPVGAVDAYPKNAEVMHKSKHWKSEVDANVWEPGVYGWVLK